MSPTPAYELSDKLDWLNAEPQRIAAHRGRIVILLFWSASSVYCHNILHDLAQIQRRWPDAVSVLAIHLPKFNAEQDAKLLGEAVTRLDIGFPVANDREWITWQHYAAHSWPSMVLIDGKGRHVADFVGDDQTAALETRISAMLESATPAGSKPGALKAKARSKVFSTLNAPSGLAIAKGLLYIADAGHHRILECALDGRIIREFGNGVPLFLDGSAADSSFHRPTALTVFREHVYVADTGNHAVRRLSLLHGSVDTLLGDGRPGFHVADSGHEVAAVRLNNPSGLCIHQDSLIVADSGNNRLGILNLSNPQFINLVGGGAFGLLDGVGDRARLAHPLGLAGTQNFLYMVEGTASALRTVAVPEGRVNTLIGHGLYQFGNADGTRQAGAMQHPTGVVVDEARGMAWIADAYNRKVRSYHLKNNLLSTVSLMQNLLRPSALALDAESLWIADSAGNHIYRYFFESEYLSRINIHSA
jgi:sugar lactone lactonase YvrE/thiol-disulfide isomerase/thioredoxin